MGHRSVLPGVTNSQCGAKTRAGTACQSPPVAGRKRCALVVSALVLQGAVKTTTTGAELDYGGDRGAPMAAIARPGIRKIGTGQ
jgi:hypothetical protein